ncbi:MAG: histidinol dehydrogenase [Flammeovirgaceae bacterium]
MQVIRYPNRIEWENILARPVFETVSLQEKVAGILQDIAQNGNSAVKKYTQQFDQVVLDELLVSEQEFVQAAAQVDEALKQAIETAKNNIERFHASQWEESKVVETMPGVSCWRKSVPIEKVGLYIPGGTAPLFSTLLMLGVPAQIAGCQEIVLCTPPQKDGSVNPVILYTAQLLGIKQLYKIGGVQAIGAMAFGTETIPKVYKIFGPGNQYVTAAKQYVSQLDTAIDMPAGPSEVAIMADSSCVPAFVAADLLSQAEHGVDSQVLLVTTEESIIEPIQQEVAKQLDALPRKAFAAQALENSRIVLVNDDAEMLAMINTYAPEHLIISTANFEALANQITNAGSVFLGNFTPESAGDYASGTNHTLPTNGHARTYSGVSLDSFIKKITFQQITQQGMQQIGNTIEQMAAAELLDAHKNAVTLRLAAIK